MDGRTSQHGLYRQLGYLRFDRSCGRKNEKYKSWFWWYHVAKPQSFSYCRTVWDFGNHFPDRIDLGLGRAPGSDQLTAMPLRRNQETAQNFPGDVRQLQQYFSPDNQRAKVRAFPAKD